MVKKGYNYEFKGLKGIARAFISNQPASLKYSTELAREIKGKRVERVERLLQNILEGKEFIPLRVYRKKVAHRKGEARSFTKSGRYPVKTVRVFQKLLGLVKANADYNGLDSENLMIVHAFASKGFSRISHQPQGKIGGKRRRRKSVHLEIVAREAAG